MIQISDLFGRRVWKKRWNDLNGESRKQIDLDQLAPGFYYLTINKRLAAKLQIH